MTWVFWYVGMVIAIASVLAGMPANLLLKPTLEEDL